MSEVSILELELQNEKPTVSNPVEAVVSRELHAQGTIMKYLDNITTEIRRTNRSTRGCKKATKSKLKAFKKLLKYQCRANGSFNLAKAFK